MRHSPPHKNSSGFSLLETLAALAIISVLTVGIVGLSSNLMNAQQARTTEQRVADLHRAITGNPVVVADQGRAAYGYYGDMGRMPAQLSDLWVRGGQPAFVFSGTAKVGAGWNGPYADVMIAEHAVANALDGWGFPLTYSSTAFTEAATGSQALARILSLGTDGIAGSDDISVSVYKNHVQSRVHGFVKDVDGVPVPDVAVALNLPVNGTLSALTTNTDASGYYSFDDVPYGNRSIGITPKLVYAPGTARIVANSSDDDFTFTVKNYGAAPIAITSMSVTYNSEPQAFFQRLLVGTTEVFDDNNPRYQSGQTLTFSAKTVGGTGVAVQPVQIAVQSMLTEVRDVIVGTVGAGGSLKFTLENARSAISGGSAVDITGVSFQVTLGDSLGGSSVIIVVPST